MEQQQLWYEARPQRLNRRFFRDTQVASLLELRVLIWLQTLLTSLYERDAWNTGLLNYPKTMFSDGQRTHTPDITIDFDADMRTFEEALRTDGAGLLHIAVKPANYPDLEGEFMRLHAVRVTHPEADLAIVVGDWDPTEHAYRCRFHHTCLSRAGCDHCIAELANAA
jgi:hypothetical protein